MEDVKSNSKEENFYETKASLIQVIDGFYFDKKIDLTVKTGLLHAISKLVDSFRDVGKYYRGRQKATITTATENLETTATKLEELSEYVKRAHSQDITLRDMIAGISASCRQQAKAIENDARENNISDMQERAKQLDHDFADLKQKNITAHNRPQEENPQFVYQGEGSRPNYDDPPAQK